MNKKVTLFYDCRYNADVREIGINIPFALDRGQMVLNELALKRGRSFRYYRPKPLTDEDFRLVHTAAYLETLKDPNVWGQIFGLGKPPMKDGDPHKAVHKLLSEIRIKAGGTVEAARAALKRGLAANLGAGYHHAYADHGDGYCAINDIAIAVRAMQGEGLAKKVLIVDVDLHQGNGTASIFQDDPDVFTFSIHAKEAYPKKKEKGSLDINISEANRDSYLERFQAGMHKALATFSPDLCIFVQGSDAYEKDAAAGSRYLRLTLEQLKTRDEFVIDTMVDRNIPIALVFAGGYGPEAWRVHFNAVYHMFERSQNN